MKASLRPSAVEISERVSELKQSSGYMEAMLQAAQCSQDPQMQISSQNHPIDTDMDRQLVGQINEMQKAIALKDRAIETKERELQLIHQQLQEARIEKASKDEVLEANGRARQQIEEHLHASEQLVSELLQSVQQKDKAILDLEQIVSVQDKNIKQLEQGDTEALFTTLESAPKDISRMMWQERNSAPEAMCVGAAVVLGNTAFFAPAKSHTVYSYQSIEGLEKWTKLPDNPNGNVSLAVISGVVTSIGGCDAFGPSKYLFSLKWEDNSWQWSEKLPPMPTSHDNVASIATESFLVVAGGEDGESAGKAVDVVEVMNVDTKLWTTVSPLPLKLRSLSAAVFGNKIYLAGGIEGYILPTIKISLHLLTT